MRMLSSNVLHGARVFTALTSFPDPAPHVPDAYAAACTAVSLCPRRGLSSQGGSSPKIYTISLGQMVSLRPDALLTQLRLLFAVVMVLFGLMIISAAILLADDHRFHRRLLAELTRTSLGFRVEECGAWTWDLALAEAERAVELPQQAQLSRPPPAITAKSGRHRLLGGEAAAAAAPSAFASGGGAARVQVSGLNGPLANLAKLVGVPAIRMRMAIPEEIWPGDISALFGSPLPLGLVLLTMALSSLLWLASAGSCRRPTFFAGLSLSHPLQ